MHFFHLAIEWCHTHAHNYYYHSGSSNPLSRELLQSLQVEWLQDQYYQYHRLGQPEN